MHRYSILATQQQGCERRLSPHGCTCMSGKLGVLFRSLCFCSPNPLVQLPPLYTPTTTFSDLLLPITAGVATQLDECRQWLRHTQGFVLQLLKQAQGFAADDGSQQQQQHPIPISSMDASSSMEEGSCSASTAAPNSAASLHAWRTMCQEASDALGTVAESMANGGSKVGAGKLYVCVCMLRVAC